MIDYSRGGEHSAARELVFARSILAEARARQRACPWHERTHLEVERAEARLERAVDALIDAAGYSAVPSASAERH